MTRTVDKGLVNSRIGLVLMTPVLLPRRPKENIAEKSFRHFWRAISLFPSHNTTYETLHNVSPLLASRSSLDTSEDSMAVVATKIAELVTTCRFGGQLIRYGHRWR